jgi:hypothetical protein
VRATGRTRRGFGRVKRRRGSFFGWRVRGSGDEQCTGERGGLEREASSGRGEWERGSVSFYRERERRGRVCQGEGTVGLHGYH